MEDEHVHERRFLTWDEACDWGEAHLGCLGHKEARAWDIAQQQADGSLLFVY